MNVKAAALVLTASLAAATAVSAETLVSSRAVSVAGVDFSQPAQVQSLYGRLQAAARDVCRTTPETATAQAPAEARACSAAALDGAVQQIDRPELSLAHRAPATSTLASR